METVLSPKVGLFLIFNLVFDALNQIDVRWSGPRLSSDGSPSSAFAPSRFFVSTPHSCPQLEAEGAYALLAKSSAGPGAIPEYLTPPTTKQQCVLYSPTSLRESCHSPISKGEGGLSLTTHGLYLGSPSRSTPPSPGQCERGGEIPPLQPSRASSPQGTGNTGKTVPFRRQRTEVEGGTLFIAHFQTPRPMSLDPPSLPRPGLFVLSWLPSPHPCSSAPSSTRAPIVCECVAASGAGPCGHESILPG